MRPMDWGRLVLYKLVGSLIGWEHVVSPVLDWTVELGYRGQVRFIRGGQ